jgi:hypothetical protein
MSADLGVLVVARICQPDNFGGFVVIDNGYFGPPASLLQRHEHQLD